VRRARGSRTRDVERYSVRISKSESDLQFQKPNAPPRRKEREEEKSITPRMIEKTPDTFFVLFFCPVAG
jgi:hypothetical protein